MFTVHRYEVKSFHTLLSAQSAPTKRLCVYAHSIDGAISACASLWGIEHNPYWQFSARLLSE
jgi:hypothetical protein